MRDARLMFAVTARAHDASQRSRRGRSMFAITKTTSRIIVGEVRQEDAMSLYPRLLRKSAWDLLLVAWRCTGMVHAIGAEWRS